MNMRTILGSVALAAVAWLGLVSPAFATTQTINLNQIYTGNIPDGPSPWLTATFTYTEGSKTGVLTLKSNLSDSDFVQGWNGVTGWGFYLSGNSLANYSCAGVCANTVSTSALNSGPVPGGFDFGFGWKSNNRFDQTDSAIYTLTFVNSLSGSPFVANAKGWLSYAHVQGLNGGCSGFIVSGNGTLGEQGGYCDGTPPPVNVPEPSALGMLGLGAMLIGVFIGLRRRYA